MTAIEQLAAFYEADGTSESFADDLHAHLISGCSYITPDNLALCRPVCSGWPDSDIWNPRKTIGLTECADCWYVWAAIGDMDFLLSLIPYPLEWIAFARDKNGKRSAMKKYPFTRFRR